MLQNLRFGFLILTIPFMVALFGCSAKSPEERSALAQKLITAKLDLDKNQRQLLKVVADQMVEVSKTLKKEREQAIQDIVMGNRFDEPKAFLHYDEQIAIFQKAGKDIIPNMAKFFNALNAEQRKELQILIKKYALTPPESGLSR